MPDEGTGLVRQVWDKVGDVAVGDMVKGGLQEDALEDRLVELSGGRRGKAGKSRLGLL